MNTNDKIKVLQQIINTGACGITPPIVGYLVDAGIMKAGGFDIAQAQNELQRLKGETA